MNDLVAKISSYDIFNNLVPGAIFAFLLTALGIYQVDTSSVVVDVVLFYFLGLIVSRIGSVVIDPILTLTGIIKKTSYTDFIDASGKDPKILTLLESRNLYRTIVSLLVVTLIAYHAKALVPEGSLSPAFKISVVLLGLAALFILAYRKQSGFIAKRVEHHKS